MEMTWEQWHAELDAVFRRRANLALAQYTGPDNDDCWREMYEDGLTPEEAFGEEASCVAQDMDTPN